jgi:hypothetical protein
MDAYPTRKYSGELRNLKRVGHEVVVPGKIYYIRMRNRDKGANIWGTNQDFIGKINIIDATGISFDAIYTRNADPRHGRATWKKTDDRVLLLKESLTKRNIDDNTTFYVPADTNVSKGKTRKAGRTRAQGWEKPTP